MKKILVLPLLLLVGCFSGEDAQDQAEVTQVVNHGTVITSEEEENRQEEKKEGILDSLFGSKPKDGGDYIQSVVSDQEVSISRYDADSNLLELEIGHAIILIDMDNSQTYMYDDRVDTWQKADPQINGLYVSVGKFDFYPNKSDTEQYFKDLEYTTNAGKSSCSSGTCRVYVTGPDEEFKEKFNKEVVDGILAPNFGEAIAELTKDAVNQTNYSTTYIDIKTGWITQQFNEAHTTQFGILKTEIQYDYDTPVELKVPDNL